MKKSLLLFCLCSTLAFGQSKDQYIINLLSKEDYFTLRRDSALLDQLDSPLIRYMSKTLLGAYFNNPGEAIDNIKILLDRHQDEMGMNNTLSMVYLMAESYAALSQYDAAYTISSSLVSQVGDAWSGETLNHIKNASRVYNALKNVPKESIRFDSCEIETTLHKGFIIIPVTDHNGNTHPFIFDTGAASHSVMSESSAQQFGAKILADSIVGIAIPDLIGKIGIVDKMTIGHIVAENIVVNILPDSLLQHRYKENQFDFSNILGWDIIGRARTIELSKKHVAFNKHYPNTILSNLMYKPRQVRIP